MSLPRTNADGATATHVDLYKHIRILTFSPDPAPLILGPCVVGRRIAADLVTPTVGEGPMAETRRVFGLDMLRAIAIGSVMIGHARLFFWECGPRGLIDALGLGDV